MSRYFPFKTHYFQSGLNSYFAILKKKLLGKIFLAECRNGKIASLIRFPVFENQDLEITVFY